MGVQMEILAKHKREIIIEGQGGLAFLNEDTIHAPRVPFDAEVGLMVCHCAARAKHGIIFEGLEIIFLSTPNT